MLRPVYASNLLGRLQPNRSDFVRGFLLKCAESRLDSQQTLLAIVSATRVHPAIAREFEKCGMVKVSNGPASPGIPGMPQPIKPPAGGAPQPMLRQPQAQQPQPGVTPAGQENMFTAPFNAIGELWSGGPVAQHFFGFSKLDPKTSESTPTVQPASAPGPSLAERGVGVTRTALSGLGALPAVGVDTIRGATEGNWNMDYSKMMGRSLMSGVNRNLGTNIGHDVAARPAGDFGKTDIGPDAGRSFFGEGIDPVTGRAVPGALKAVGKYMGEQSQLPDAEGGTARGRTMSAIAEPVFNYAEPALTMAAGAKMLPGGAAKNVTGLAKDIGYRGGAVVGAAHAADEAFDDPQLAEQRRVANTAAMRGEQQTATSQPADQQHPIDPPPGDQPSGVAATPMYEQIVNFVKQAPEKAMEFGKQAIGKLQSAFQSEPGKLEVDSVSKTGGLTPQGQQQALTAITNEGNYNFEQAWQILGNMSVWEQLGLWGGVGLAAVGLLNALSGEGGIGSLLMSMLGIGAAGYTAANAGLLDQGSKDLAGTIGSTIGQATGQSAPQQTPPGLKEALPGLMDSMPDDAISPMLSHVQKNYPAYAQQLDRASGRGSWGNAFISWLGDLTGYRQQMMQDQLGLNPQQQDRLLQLWRNQGAQ